MSAVTDSLNKIEFQPEVQPGIANLLTIYASLKKITIEETVSSFSTMGYGVLKQEVGTCVEEFLTQLQERYHSILSSNLI